MTSSRRWGFRPVVAGKFDLMDLGARFGDAALNERFLTFELKNYESGDVGLFTYSGAGVEVGKSFPAGGPAVSAAMALSSDWTDFYTEESYSFADFAGTARVYDASVDIGIASLSPVAGVVFHGIGVDHGPWYKDLLHGDAVDVSGFAQQLNAPGVSASYAVGTVSLVKVVDGEPVPSSFDSFTALLDTYLNAVDVDGDGVSDMSPEAGHARDPSQNLTPQASGVEPQEHAARLPTDTALPDGDADIANGPDEERAQANLLPAEESWELVNQQSLTVEALEDLVGVDLDGSENVCELPDDTELPDEHAVGEWQEQRSIPRDETEEPGDESYGADPDELGVTGLPDEWPGYNHAQATDEAGSFDGSEDVCELPDDTELPDGPAAVEGELAVCAPGDDVELPNSRDSSPDDASATMQTADSVE